MLLYLMAVLVVGMVLEQTVAVAVVADLLLLELGTQ
jgi:hypothetical protein